MISLNMMTGESVVKTGRRLRRHRQKLLDTYRLRARRLVCCRTQLSLLCGVQQDKVNLLSEKESDFPHRQENKSRVVDQFTVCSSTSSIIDSCKVIVAAVGQCVDCSSEDSCYCCHCCCYSHCALESFSECENSIVLLEDSGATNTVVSLLSSSYFSLDPNWKICRKGEISSDDDDDEFGMTEWQVPRT
ncbi:unnamed protein product [Orchesella dallaii]|uniref:Uncharacterized protein n=1 Tax=Orchesella dallaii TaxID=48710 RepID=A0ABP1PNE0_9HEXA